MLKELLITIAMLQLDTVSATLMLLETAAMLVSLEHSISQLVKVIEAAEHITFLRNRVMIDVEFHSEAGEIK